MTRTQTSEQETLALLKLLAASEKSLSVKEIRDQLHLTAGQAGYRLGKLTQNGLVDYIYPEGFAQYRVSVAGKIAARSETIASAHNGHYADLELARIGASSFHCESEYDYESGRLSFVLYSDDKQYDNNAKFEGDDLLGVLGRIPDDAGDNIVYAVVCAYADGSLSGSIHAKQAIYRAEWD
jgi:hypothetical protein